MGYYKKFGTNIIYHYKEKVEDYFDEIGYKKEFLLWKTNKSILYDLKIHEINNKSFKIE